MFAARGKNSKRGKKSRGDGGWRDHIKFPIEKGKRAPGGGRYNGSNSKKIKERTGENSRNSREGTKQDRLEIALAYRGASRENRFRKQGKPKTSTRKVSFGV